MQTGAVARRESEVVQRWLERHKGVLIAMGAVMGGALAAIIASSPELSASMAGVRLELSLLGMAIGEDLAPGFEWLEIAAGKVREGFEGLDKPSRVALSLLTLIGGVAAGVGAALGAIGLAGAAAAAGFVAVVAAIAIVTGAWLKFQEGVIEKGVHGFLNWLTSLDWDALWGKMGEGLSKAGQWIKETAGKIWTWIGEMAGKIGELLGGLGDKSLAWGRDMLQRFWDGISGVWNNAKVFISSIATVIANWFLELGTNAWTWGRDLVKNLATAASGIWPSVQGLVSAISDKIAEWFDDVRGLAFKAKKWGADFLSNFISGLRSKISDLEKAVGDAVAKLNPLKFDIVANDAMAARWGGDFVRHFATGMRAQQGLILGAARDSLGAIATPAPVAAGPRSGATISIVIERGAIVAPASTGSASADLDRFGEALARHLGDAIGGRTR